MCALENKKIIPEIVQIDGKLQKMEGGSVKEQLDLYGLTVPINRNRIQYRFCQEQTYGSSKNIRKL